MDIKKIYSLVLALMFIVATVFWFTISGVNKDNQNIACTMEAKICPDGSAVGRIGPNCEFEACPAVAPVAINQAGEVVLGFGETGSVGGLSITMNSLVQDSRCPQGVQCIWAGELRVNVSFASATGTETKEMVLGGKAHVFEGYSISLVDATGVPKRTEPIAVSDYRLLFKVVEN